MSKKKKKSFLIARIKSVNSDRILSLSFKLLFILFLTASFYGCKKQDTASIKKTVSDYNIGLIRAAKTGSIKSLKGIASNKILEKLKLWIASWRDSNLYMDAKLIKIRYKKIDISGQSASVQTSENWIFEYKKLQSNRIALPYKNIHYNMLYTLKKNTKRWLITAIKIISG